MKYTNKNLYFLICLEKHIHILRKERLSIINKEEDSNS